MNNRQQGYSVVAGILVLVIVGLIACVGLYVWQKNQAKPAINGTSQEASQKPQTNIETTDPTAEWATYTSDTGKFSIKYPKAWVTAINPQNCADGIFMLGANSDSVGKCGSSSFGQMTITWRGDRQFCGDLNSDMWTQDSKEAAIVAGANATKITATAKMSDQVEGSMHEGAKTVQYCFVSNGMAYIANYTQRAAYPDVLSDFNLMITKTLAIN